MTKWDLSNARLKVRYLECPDVHALLAKPRVGLMNTSVGLRAASGDHGPGAQSCDQSRSHSCARRLFCLYIAIRIAA